MAARERENPNDGSADVHVASLATVAIALASLLAVTPRPDRGDLVSAMVYDGFIEGFARAELDWVGDTFRVVLADDGYEPDPTHSSRADLGDYELGSVPGYNRGGELLRSRKIEPVAPSGLRLVGGEVTWTHFTGRFRYAVVCQDNGSRSADRLISFTDLGEQSFTDATVTVSYEREGVCVFAPEVVSTGG